MKTLPRALSSWAEELAAFTDEARTTLGPWLPILDRLIGPHTDRSDPAGEPDGFSGLGRHGRYERMALSQWGLLEDAPEEFLRRAGSGEHLFHQIARTSRAGGRSLLVLFDAGPAQLGAPRLVHLAWLLVLARRAHRNGIALSWGILQTPGAELRREAGPSEIRALLGARSPEPVTPQALAAWRERLGPPTEAQERWVVSASDPWRQGELLAAAHLFVREPDEPGARELGVESVPRHGPRNRARLPLPRDERWTRLLIDPFPVERKLAMATSEDETLHVGAQVAFAGPGIHLVAKLASSDLVILAVPRQPEQSVVPLARFAVPRSETLIAAGWCKGRMYVATVSGHNVEIRVSQGRRWRRGYTIAVPPGMPLPRPSPAVLSPLTLDRRTGGLWFGDASWCLYHADIGSQYLSLVPRSVLAYGWTREGLTSVGRRGAGPIELFQHSRASAAEHRLHGPRVESRVVIEGLPLASEGYLALGPQGQAAAVAVCAGDGQWKLADLSNGARQEISVRTGSPVFGLALAQKVPALLIRAESGDRLDLVSSLRQYDSFSFPDQVEHACLQPGGQLIAAQVNGGVMVMDRAGRIRLRWGGRR